MKRSLRHLFIFIVVVICAIATFLHNTDNQIQTTDVYKQEGIEKLSITVDGDDVQLEVTTSYAISCTNIIQVLDIEELHLKSKTYNPVCTIISPNLAVIKYVA